MCIRPIILTTATTLLCLTLALGLTAQQSPLLPMEGHGGWGYVDLTGAWVIPPQFQQATRFSEGHALVLQHGSWHFIDDTGQNTVGHRFDSQGSSTVNDIELFSPGASLFSEGLAAVYEPFTGPVFIRPDGEIAIEVDGALEVGLPFSFRDGLAVAYSDRLEVGYIDNTGAWVIPPTFQRARAFSEGLAAAMDDETELWGYIDRSGSWVIEPRFGDVGDFASGLAPVSFEWPRWAGYIDPSGEFVIAGDFREAAPFSSGLAHVIDGEGSYFIDPDGVRVLDEAVLAPFCFTGSLRDGLALVVIATEEGCDYTSSGSGDMAFVQPLQGLLGYIDTTGSVVVRQSQAERDAMIAERRRAEQEVLDAETARLAACPAVVEYGEPGSGNYLLIRSEGKERILHFEATAIDLAWEGRVRLMLPGFGSDEGPYAMTTHLSYHLHERGDQPGDYVLQTHVFGATSPRLDCISIPEDILRQRGATIQLEAFTLPGPGQPGHAAGSITDPARSAGEDGVEFHFDTSIFAGLDVTEVSTVHHASGPFEQVEIVHHPTRRVLTIELTAGDETVEYTLADFAGDAGVYYQRLGSLLRIFDVSRFGSGGAAIDVLELDISDFVAAEENSFFSFGRDERLRERYTPDRAERVLSVVASSYVTEPHLPTLAFTPVASAEPARPVVDDRGPEERLAHALFASMFSGARETHLTIDDLPRQVNEGLPALRAYEWSLRATDMPLVVRETAGPVDGDVWQIAVEAKVEEEEEEPQDATDATIMLCSDLMEGLERLEIEAVDEESFIAGAIPLMIAAGIVDDPGASGEIDPEAMFEAFYERCGSAFDQGLEAIYNEMMRDAHEERAADMGLQLKVDASSGAPLHRSFSSRGTRIDVEYRQGHALITAENDAQGRHQAEFAVPDGILDIAQLHAVLAALSLEQGYAKELYFLATVPGTSMTTELLPDGSAHSSSQRTVDPRFVRVVLMVDHLAPATDALGEEAYVVKVGVEPNSYGTWPLGINPPVREDDIAYVLYYIGRESRALLAVGDADGITVRRIH